MDLGTDTLKFIYALSKADDCNEPDSQESFESLKHRQRVLDLCVEIKNRGHATHLKMDRITASELALETLLHLTSKRAGEWVKHELRALSGLDSIVNEVETSLRCAKIELKQFGWTEEALERLRKVDPCLQVLQQVTFNLEDNQKYLLGQSVREIETPSGGALREKCVEASPKIFVELFRFCKDTLLQLNMQLESAVVLKKILLNVLRLLINLSHDYNGVALGSEVLRSYDGFLELCLYSKFDMGRLFPPEMTFDVLIHALNLLVNLVENNLACRSALLKCSVQKRCGENYSNIEQTSSRKATEDKEQSILEAFVMLFLRYAQEANLIESNICDEFSAEQLLDSITRDDNRDNSGQVPESCPQQSLILTAVKNMETGILTSYISIFLAFLLINSPTSVIKLRQLIPGGFLSLLASLKRLWNQVHVMPVTLKRTRDWKTSAILSAVRFYEQEDPESGEEMNVVTTFS